MVKALARRGVRHAGAAHVAEFFLEADQFLAGARIARRHRAACAGVAALKRYFANLEAHHEFSSSPNSWSSQNAGTPSISSVVRNRSRTSFNSIPGKRSQTACSEAVETMVGPGARPSSGAPSGM